MVSGFHESAGNALGAPDRAAGERVGRGRGFGGKPLIRRNPKSR